MMFALRSAAAVTVFLTLSACGRPAGQQVAGESWQTGLETATAWRYQPPLIADFDADGMADIAVQLRAPHVVIVAQARVAGGFEPFAEWIDRGFGGFEVDQQTIAGDFNGDGLTDVMLHSRRHIVHVALNRGRGLGFERGRRWLQGGANVLDLPTFAADLNGDGCDDIVVETLAGQVWAGFAGCSRGPAGNRFQPLSRWTEVPEGRGGRPMRAADFDGDGRDDLYYQDSGGHLFVSASLGRKGGDFVLVTGSPFGGGPFDYDTLGIDFDGDRRADLFVQCWDGTVQVALNRAGLFKGTDLIWNGIGGGPFGWFPAVPHPDPGGGLSVVAVRRDLGSVVRYRLPPGGAEVGPGTK